MIPKLCPDPSARARLALVLLTAALGGVVITNKPAWTDDVRPVQVQIREQEPGTYLVQWQVPQLIPAQAMPRPVLPQSCSPQGERTVVEQPGAWLNRQMFRCAEGISGQTLSLEYPFGNPSLSTVIRVELLSGERHATLLAPTETSWQVPATASIDAPLRAARRGVLDGVVHVFQGGLHLVFLIAVISLGGLGLIGRLGLGHAGAVALAAMGFRIALPLGEIALGLATVLLAWGALETDGERRKWGPMVVAAGCVHGLGWASVTSGAVPLALGALGMDTTLFLLGAGLLRLVRTKTFLPRVAAYGSGSVAVAAILALFVAGSSATPPGSRADGPVLPALAGQQASGGQGSQRVAPQRPDAAVQSFLAVEGLEVRHEVLIRLADVAGALDIATDSTIDVDVQADVKQRVAALVSNIQVLEIDGTEQNPAIEIVDFMTVDAQGVLPRPTPVPEGLEAAFVGVTVVHLTPSTAQTVALSWDAFGLVDEIPTTITDPEVSRATILTADQPAVRWDNTLAEDPVPTVEATRIEPRQLPVPLLAIPFLLAALALVGRRLRGRGPEQSLVLARVSLTVGLLIGPLGAVAVNVPFSAAPSEVQAQRILAGILPNVYRAFEFRDEATAYDRLAVSITGETLTDIYLEHRRALEMEERGGARARPEAVEVIGVASVDPGDTGGFDAEASWSVSGTVTHYGHRHFRQNRYQARVAVVPVDGAWKIRTVDIIDEVRVQ